MKPYHWIEGQKITWDPFDESPENYQIGRLFFGDCLDEVIRQSKAAPVASKRGDFVVSKIDVSNRSITFTAVD